MSEWIAFLFLNFWILDHFCDVFLSGIVFNQKTAWFQNFWLRNWFWLRFFKLCNFELLLCRLRSSDRLSFFGFDLDVASKKVVSILNVTSVIGCLYGFLIYWLAWFLWLGITDPIFGGRRNIVLLIDLALEYFLIFFDCKPSRQYTFGLLCLHRLFLFPIDFVNIRLQVNCCSFDVLRLSWLDFAVDVCKALSVFTLLGGINR